MDIAIDHPELESVTAWLHEPAGAPRRSAFLLAHGSGADPTSEFLLAMAQGLCQRGYRVLSFRYAYMELARRAGKPRPPDRRAMLEHVHERALDTLLALEPQPRAILAGKSLGGRISTHLAAKGAIAHALVLLGYPLHPPHQPERCRSEHFPAIAQPALFLQGTRDEFCTLPLLQQALVTYGGRAQLCVLEGANHGFELTRKAGKSTRQLWDEVLERIVSFETSCFSD